MVVRIYECLKGFHPSIKKLGLNEYQALMRKHANFNRENGDKPLDLEVLYLQTNPEGWVWHTIYHDIAVSNLSWITRTFS